MTGQHPGIRNDRILQMIDKVLNVDDMADMIKKKLLMGGQRLSIYGMGRIGKIIVRELKNTDIPFSELYDRRGGEEWIFQGMTVKKSTDALDKEKDNVILITVTDEKISEKIIADLRSFGFLGDIVTVSELFDKY